MNIRLNKNRGWRGLAELELIVKDDVVHKCIFSFSSDTWADLLNGYITYRNPNTHQYCILQFNNTDKLPKPTQQRSVLIKDFEAEVIDIHTYSNIAYTETISRDWFVLNHFMQNTNHHTTSEFNNVGVRVVPDI